MANEIKVNQTPIQRNILDVSMELTKMYFTGKAIESCEQLQEVYTKFYSVAVSLENTNARILREKLPENIRKIME